MRRRKKARRHIYVGAQRVGEIRREALGIWKETRTYKDIKSEIRKHGRKVDQSPTEAIEIESMIKREKQ